jgi:hypothetical protein
MEFWVSLVGAVHDRNYVPRVLIVVQSFTAMGEFNRKPDRRIK